MKNATAMELPLRTKAEPCCGQISSPSLSKKQAHDVAELLKAVADPTRIGILDLLASQSQPICVCDITPRFDQNQPTISHHLRLLRDAGLVETVKRGLWSYYWPTDRGRTVLSLLTRIR